MGWARSDWTCGTFDLSGPLGRDRGEALVRLSEWLTEQMAGCRLLVIERPFGRSAFTSDLPGIIAARCHEAAFRVGVPRAEFTVSAVRKAVLGKGNAPKRDVLPAMKAAGWPCKSDHEADAAALLMAAIEAAKAGEALAA